MYNYIVKQQVKKSFGLVNERRFDELVNDMVLNVRHSFAGDQALGGVRHDQAAVRVWLGRLARIMPTLHLTVTDIDVTGLPHHTLAIVRWTATATLETGEPYLNKGVHFITLRWGKVVSIDVYEDTLAVYNGLEAQFQAGIDEAHAPQIIS